MGGPRQQGQEAGERNRALPEGKVVTILGVVIVEMGADQARGKAAKVLLVIDETQVFLGGGVAKVVPVAEGGGGKLLEDVLPKIIRRDFPKIFAAFQAQLQAQGGGLFADSKKKGLHAGPDPSEGGLHCTKGLDFFPDKPP